MAFCYDYAYRHEMNALRSKESQPFMKCYALALYSYTMNEQYSTVISRLNGNDDFVERPKMMRYNNAKQLYYAKKSRYLNDNQQQDVEGWVNICNKCYTTSLNG